MSYKIIGDSCMDLTPALAQDTAHFACVPMTLEIGSYSIRDDADFDQADFLKRMRESSECPRSACPSPDEFMQEFETEADDIYVITITGHLSGTYNAACLGKQLYEEKHGDAHKNIAIIDSLSASAGETAVARFVQALCEAGVPFETVVKEAETYVSRMQTFFILEDLEPLRKNGRLSGTAALFASALNLKPVLFADNGEIKKFDTARGINKALKKMCTSAVERAKASGVTPKRVVITHCNCEDRAQIVKEELQTLLPFEEILVAPTRGVATLYAGDGGVVIAL